MATLSSLTSLRTSLQVPSTDTSENTSLSQYLDQAEALIREWVHQRWSVPPAIYTDYLDGRNTSRLRLRQRPVRVSIVSGTLTSGSAVVTSTTTTGLVAGMPVSNLGTGFTTGVPAGTTISSVDSATQMTLSAAAQSSGSQSLYVGAAVYLDQAGFYGSGETPFPSSTQLVPGLDFAVIPDQYDYSSRSGLLERIGGVWPPLVEYTRGYLHAGLRDTRGPVKVVYAAGFATGSVPADIELAVNLVAANLRTLRLGAPVNSHSYDGFSISMTRGRRLTDPMEPAMSILSRYRSLDMGI